MLLISKCGFDAFHRPLDGFCQAIGGLYLFFDVVLVDQTENLFIELLENVEFPL